MIQIKRRYNFDEWEPIAEYEDGEFTGDEDFLDAFSYLEGEDEERILNRFDGPNLLAEQIEENEDQSPSISDEIAESAAEKLSSGSAGAGSATYGGARDTTEPHPDEEDDDEEEKAFWKVMEDRRQQSLSKGAALSKQTSFSDIDDELMKFYTHVVWWGLDKQESEEKALDLSKSPDMWRSSDEVPEFVEEYIREAVADDAFWQGRLENLPPGSEQHVQRLFEEKMTQPQGWSLGSLIDDLKSMFPGTEEEYLLMMTRNEVAALANKAREEAYEAAEKEGETFEFYWSGPQDFRTTPICEEMKQKTHPRFGGTPRSKGELRDLLERTAKKYDDGTLERIEEWVPHFQCRHTFVRKVYL